MTPPDLDHAVDSNPAQTFSGFRKADAFQQLLFGAPNLNNGAHTLTIVNAGPLTSNDSSLVYFDVDWVTFEQAFTPPYNTTSDVVSMSQLMMNETTYSADNGVTYEPSEGQWPASTFISASGSILITRTTVTPNASAVLNFTLPYNAGSGAIGLFGSMDQAHGNYSVSFYEVLPDSETVIQAGQYSGKYGYNVVHEQMLFYQDSLVPGSSYCLEIVNMPNGTNTGYFGLDYVKTWSIGVGALTGVPGYHRSR